MPSDVDLTTIRVFIKDKAHPHYGESGRLTGGVIRVLGEPMAHVQLEDCKHGTGACYVKVGQIDREKRTR